MGIHFLAQLLLVFKLVYADVMYSEVHFIAPSLPDGRCPQNFSCLTLSQFAATSSYNKSDTLSLIFLPGNHTLNTVFSLAPVNSLFMTKEGLADEIVYVSCSLIFGRFHISETTFVSINDFNFIGCGNNSVSRVRSLTITDTTFRDVAEGLLYYTDSENTRSTTLITTVLTITEVTNATILRSFFLYNSLSYYPYLYLGFSGVPTDHVCHFSYRLSGEKELLANQQSKLGGVLSVIFSNVSVISSKFMHNKVDRGGSGALSAKNSSLYLAQNTYINNTATLGGVMVTSGSTIDIESSTFINNEALGIGGVMVTFESTVSVTNCHFMKNRALYNGGVMVAYTSTYTIRSSMFTSNFAFTFGGVLQTLRDSSVMLFNNSFIGNSVDYGGVMTISDSSFNISNSKFTSNNASYCGGVLFLRESRSSAIINISNSIFTNNRAQFGGVMYISGYTYYASASVSISTSIFANNSALDDGGVMEMIHTFLVSINCFFSNNSAANQGGVMRMTDSSLTIGNNNFVSNSAPDYGGVMWMSDSILNFSNSSFVNNQAIMAGAVIWCADGTLNVVKSQFHLNAVFYRGGGVIFIRQCSASIINSTFDQNNGSMYTFNSNLTCGGYSTFKNCTEPLVASTFTSQEGGAITSFQSTVIFTRDVYFLNNHASDGGAVLATESTLIVLNGRMSMADNVAKLNGGGISLKQSDLEVRGVSTISSNTATRGGGIHSSGSTVVLYQLAYLEMINNTAELGGGMYLELNPKLYIQKVIPTNIRGVQIGVVIPLIFNNLIVINFTGNHATYGAAIYVADDTNSGACSSNVECFIQTLALHQTHSAYLNTAGIQFSVGNVESEKEPILFGGLLDRCIPSPFSEVYLKKTARYDGVTYLGNISNIDLDSISSQPVRICFCNSEHEPDCSYQPPTISIAKGRAFNISLVAVDQVNHTVDANVTASLSSTEGGFGEGQQIQGVSESCTNLTFNVFSPLDFETLNVHADGPCEGAAFSTSHVSIQFTNCTCPVGFQPLSTSQSQCVCVCDLALSPYITECNIATSSVLRKGTNAWITYINETDPPGFIIYSNCPLGYCQLQGQNVTINFNLPNGADSQCAFNRTGVLCGACKEGLSLSLASSRCIPCLNHWPAVFVVVVLAAAIAGILLVISLLALNITVSVGLINGFIFYANIVSAGGVIFYSSTEPNFPSVFVAWFNLDIGIDVCFVDGLDAYTKTWLQLAFPVYIISLVIIVIVVSEYSPKFAALIGKRDPVSTLSTLILLSYAKLLSITITALSSATLDYPGGQQVSVWLHDGTVPWFQGKHIPLALVALVIIIFGLPFTMVLFMWQWIVRAPRWKVFNWTRNTKLNAFITTYHIPHNSKYRFWTGLLLLVRVISYIIASVTISSNPLTYPLIITLFVGGIFLLKSAFGLKIYEKTFVNVIDSLLYFNLLALSAFTQFDIKEDTTKQKAIAYTSVTITIILFIGAILYHVMLLTKKDKTPKVLNEYPLAPVKPANKEVTHSVIDPPKRDDSDQPTPVDQKDSAEKKVTENRQIVTPPYVVSQ